MNPITFYPIPMERVWGGRSLESVYGRVLPQPDVPYGESWEIVDRAEAQSVVADGPFAGKTLHELWTNHRAELFGDGYETHDRFPILIKILDARDDLSIQVHPPLHLAEALGGEPKTEMWFIAAADPGAKLYAGLKHGVTRADFESAVTAGTVADVVHSLSPAAGESIFIPSGRLHAIGAGLLIHEIQQNSDTTYRVFDWNRMGLDGKPRELHVAQSLASIDFADFKPVMDAPSSELLAECPFFRTEKYDLAIGATISSADPEKFCVLSIVEGAVNGGGIEYPKGSFLLLPRAASPVIAKEPSTILRISLPTGH